MTSSGLSGFKRPLTIPTAVLGMETESVTLKLPRTLLSGAQRVATARDVTIGHMVRQLLKREVERQLGSNRSDNTDERLLAAVQVLLARDMAEARDWDDLAARLRPHGYEVRAPGGGIVLFKSSCGTRICKGSEIGFSYGTLVKRFGAQLPEHEIGKTHLGIMPAGQIDSTRQGILTAHFAVASSWPDLINRLACEGLELRLLGAGLGIHVSATNRHLCNSETVGAAYDMLIERFGAMLPMLATDLPPQPTQGEALR